MFEPTNPPDYEKFTLKKNPFSSLSSEGIDNFEALHVSQSIDIRIAELLSEVIDNHAGVAASIVGDLGTGKTQRLKGIRKLIEDNGGVVYFQKVDSSDVTSVLRSIDRGLPRIEENVSEPVVETGLVAAIKRFFLREEPKAPEPVRKELISFEGYDPQKVAARMSEGLAMTSPSALILDEMENITTAPLSELIPFFESLRTLISDMPPSTLFVFACTPEFYEILKEQVPAFTIRLHSQLPCQRLSDRKATELVIKRLAVARADAPTDALFPFEDSAIMMVNALAKGNPRVLLRILHNILAAAARDPVIDLIDDRYVTRIVAVPNTLDEYMMKVPTDLQEMIAVIIDDFEGGPVTYISISKAIKEAPTRVYADLEELVSMGLLERTKKGHYAILEHIRAMLEE